MKYSQGSTFSTIVDYGKSLWAYTEDSLSYTTNEGNQSGGDVTGTQSRSDGVVQFGPYRKPTVVEFTATSDIMDIRNYEFEVDDFYVRSPDVTRIRVMSQDDYDAETPKDPTTQYIIAG